MIKTLLRFILNIPAALVGGGIFIISLFVLQLGIPIAIIASFAGYLVSGFLIFPVKPSINEETPERLSPGLNEGEPKLSQQPRQGWGHRHLPLLIFMATLSGSLLGALGSLSESLNLLVPIWKLMHPSPEIRIIGSNTILGARLYMAAEWKGDFQELNTWQESIPLVGERSRVFDLRVDAIGSLAGIREAEKGKGNVHVLATSEPIPDEDVNDLNDHGVTFHCAAEIGYDVVVFVTDKNNVVPILSKEDIRRILTGEIMDWSEIGPTRSAKLKPIVIFARKGSGTTDIVLQAFTGSPQFPGHFVECESNADCLNQAVGTPGSLYWVSVSWLYTQPPDYMQPILVQYKENMPPTNPYEEDFNPSWYLPELIRPLYMYVLDSDNTEPKSVDVAERFFKYVRGVRGQKILEQHNFYTYFNPPSDMNLTLPPGFGRQNGRDQGVCR